MGQLIPTGQTLYLPPGTKRTHDGGTWALYVNEELNTSWMAWQVPAGLQLMMLPGRRSVSLNLSQLSGFVNQQQANACCAKGN